MGTRLTGQSTASAGDHRDAQPDERLAIVGSGAIACGLASLAAVHGSVQLLARSTDSAARARQALDKRCKRVNADPSAVEVVVDQDAIEGATFVVEAVVEDHDVKASLLAQLAGLLSPEAILATTTSSLSVERLAAASTQPQRFVGLHVFNPVEKMQLVELAFPKGASARVRARALSFCQALGKVAVEVPDIPGFVVNRLLFPYLFSAVRLLEDDDLDASAIDACMRLGAGHPMGPLALLDFVGLDVAQAIGQAIGEPIPPLVQEHVANNRLGRKTQAGFHSY